MSVLVQKYKRASLYLYPATCSCQNGKYVVSIIDNSVITCDEIINAAGSVSTNVPANVMRTV